MRTDQIARGVSYRDGVDIEELRQARESRKRKDEPARGRQKNRKEERSHQSIMYGSASSSRMAEKWQLAKKREVIGKRERGNGKTHDVSRAVLGENEARSESTLRESATDRLQSVQRRYDDAREAVYVGAIMRAERKRPTPESWCIPRAKFRPKPQRARQGKEQEWKRRLTTGHLV